MFGRKFWRVLFLTCSFVFLFGLFLLRESEPTQADTAVGKMMPASRVRPSPPTLTSLQQPQTNSGCQSVIFNPGLDYGYGWPTFADDVLLDMASFTTEPNSIQLIEDNDSNSSSLFGDMDSFGQVFNFPNNTNSIALDFNIKYDGWGANDDVYFSFYTVDFDGQLVPPPVYSSSAQKFIDGAWHPENYKWGSTTSYFSTLKGNPTALVFYTTNDLNTFGTEQLNVRIDDVELKLCESDSVPTGSIQGTVFDSSGGNLSDAQLLLAHQAQGGPLTTIGITNPGANGSYSFENVEGLTPGDSYQVWYVNDGRDPERLGLWAGSPIAAFVDDQTLYNIDFNVKNVELISPAHETAVQFPVTFSWDDRGVANDNYYLCIYDIETLAEVCSSTPLDSEEVTIEQSDLENIPGSNFNFDFNRRYGWSITVVDGSNYNDLTFANIGYSYGANAITFVEASKSPPDNSPPPSGPPLTGNSGADWTVMVYLAGDNSLGDPNRYFDPSLNLQGQFAALKQLAQLYPAINLVTLTDFYDDSGTEFCHLKSDGTQECQQLGELDTSDPTVLSTFINDTLAVFDAERTMLIISDHGHAIGGVAVDETTSPTAVMTPDEIRQALAGAGLEGRKLDVLFYNACLMGSLEVAFDASSFADYLVASAGELWVLNIYEQLLPLLANPVTKNDPRAVAAGMVTAYEQAVQEIEPDLFISSAAFDLGTVDAVNTAVSNLAGVMANELPESRADLENIRSLVQVYDSSGNLTLGSEDAFVDLMHLVELLRDSSGNPAIETAADDVITALGPIGGSSSMIVASLQTSGSNGLGGAQDLTNASGLSVYFPNGQTSGDQPTMTNLYLNRGIYQIYHDETEWDEFLRMYISGLLNTGPVRLQSGVRPVSGALPVSAEIYLPVINRD